MEDLIDKRVLVTVIYVVYLYTAEAAFILKYSIPLRELNLLSSTTQLPQLIITELTWILRRYQYYF